MLIAVVLAGCQSIHHSDDAEFQIQRNIATGEHLDTSGYLYDPRDTSCDGFPKLRVETAPGTCLGLVLPRERAVDPVAKKGFIKPRVMVQLPNSNDFLITDMGGWNPGRGMLFLMKQDTTGQYSLKLLKSGLNLPHGLALYKDGKFYIGESSQLSRFNYKNGEISNWEKVLGDFKVPGKQHAHPLSQFRFDPSTGDLYLNSGAPSDHCFVAFNGNKALCPEEATQGEGAIYKVSAKSLASPIPAGGITDRQLIAKGLRNSMAMAIHPSGTLIQGENSRDFPEMEEPYEELNVIDLKDGEYHYGWPYCYNFHALSPEWGSDRLARNEKNEVVRNFEIIMPIDCNEQNMVLVNRYRSPYTLIPPHAAPLSADYYEGNMFPELHGKLLMTWHGYQPTGHRFVAYNVDEKGRPVLTKNLSSAMYSVNQPGSCPAARPFKPQGGATRSAPYTELISKWNEVKGQRPKGAPVNFTVANDGSIFISEDRDTRAIVRLAKSTSAHHKDDCSVMSLSTTNDPRVQYLAWRHAVKSSAVLQAKYLEVQQKMISKYCSSCHGSLALDEIAKDRFSNLDFIVKNQWIVPQKPEASRMYDAISHGGSAPAMPPGGSPQFFGTSVQNEILKPVFDFIAALPADIEKSYSRQQIKDSRRIRSAPSATALACGSVTAGQSVYIDPRPEKVIRQEGWAWSKAYFVPGHTSLTKDACPYPEDGVFYVAIRKLE